MRYILSITSYLALVFPAHTGLMLQEKFVPKAYDAKLHQMIPARHEWAFINDQHAAFTLFDLALWIPYRFTGGPVGPPAVAPI